MKHADFDTLDIESILGHVIDFARERSSAEAVYWLSRDGFRRVAETTAENAAFEFVTAELMGAHLRGAPTCDPLALWPVWHAVNELHPGGPRAPLALSSTRFVYPMHHAGHFLGALLLELPSGTSPVALLHELRPGLDLAAKYVHFGYLYLASRKESYLDDLTGLYNQRYLPMALDHEINRSRRDSAAFSLLFLDIDFFKMVNDGRGHLVGSGLLIGLSQVLRNHVRSCDYLFRYGGDEFIALLSNAGPDASAKVAERIRRAVEETTYLIEGHAINLTVSIGLASYPQHAQTASGLIQLADQAMYDGKRKSRNIVFVAS